MASVPMMTSVIEKLTSLLSDEYKHLKGVKKGIRSLANELTTIKDVLKKLADMEEDHQIHEQTRDWRNKMGELSYDIEDCIDGYLDSHLTRGDAKANFARKFARKVKKLWKDHQIGNDILELKARVVEEHERRDRYKIDELISTWRQSQPVPLDPRAPALYEEAKNIVGIDEPREKIIRWIKGEEKQRKVVSIFGTGGLGKTTLAMAVYRKIDESFDCRACVCVSRTPDIERLLRDVLSQVNESMYNESKMYGWELEHLVRKLREYLEDKRYFIIIDDLWSEEAWRQVKCALPDNNNRSRIVTTTRKKNVAEECCTGIDGHIYEALPLRNDHSERLFFGRTREPSAGYPRKMMEVAKEILRKCGGMPLAIISIAGLLANKNPTLDEWTRVRNSISSAIENGSDSTIGNMKKILFFSYFDLPHYLKPCLLYLSVFPEDYSIKCERLIWSWVAEGFIPGQNRETMEQRGRSYLHDLINRSMIQAANIDVDGTVETCRVHDVIHDFIVSKAAEENIVTVLNGNDSCDDSSNKIRRLSLQPPHSEEAITRVLKPMKKQSHLRAFHMFGSRGTPVLPEFPKSQVMRVLDIDDTSGLLESRHLEHIGSFCQLKYLRIKQAYGGALRKLPEQIGGLQHLETLDLRESGIKSLPVSIVQLQKLVCLFIPHAMPLLDGIGNLQALEMLSFVSFEQSLTSIQELGELTKLRTLGIFFPLEQEQQEVCISSISKLLNRSLQSLEVSNVHSCDIIDLWIKSCGSLRRLELYGYRMLPTIPSQIGLLVNLTYLDIQVRYVGDLENLASLPRLLFLGLKIFEGRDQMQDVTIRQKGFQQLLEFNFSSGVGALKFESGAMQKLQRLYIELAAVRVEQEPYRNSFGLHHLVGLKFVKFAVQCGQASSVDVEWLQEEIRSAVLAHPNGPVFTSQRRAKPYLLYSDETDEE